jgi:hypothetical protein
MNDGFYKEAILSKRESGDSMKMLTDLGKAPMKSSS